VRGHCLKLTSGQGAEPCAAPARCSWRSVG
jgi:hypothetical protein